VQPTVILDPYIGRTLSLWNHCPQKTSQNRWIL